jgi:RND superfamily putative drug exporter
MLLLPAVMTLMGRANWWAPGVLRRWHARHGLRDDAEPVVEPSPAPALASVDS